MRLRGRSVEDVLVGKPILTFSKELTKDAVNSWFSKLEHMDELYAAVEKVLSDGHIKSVLDNLSKLQEVHSRYKHKKYERSRKK